MLMKTKIELNLNRDNKLKSKYADENKNRNKFEQKIRLISHRETKRDVAFLSITRVFEKVTFHFEQRNIMKISCLLRSVKCRNQEEVGIFATVNLNKAAEL